MIAVRWSQGWSSFRITLLQSHRRPPKTSPRLPQPKTGIAYDASRRRIFVSGKYWPRVFEIVPAVANPNLPANKKLAQSCIV